MLKFLELLDHFERQITAGRSLVEVAHTVPGVDEMELILLEEEMDALELRITEIVDQDVSMRDVDDLEAKSGALYRRLVAIGQVVAKS